MRLKLQIPEPWLILAARSTYEPVPGVTVTIEPLVGTPPDLAAWGDRVVLAGVDRSVYRVRNVEDLKTERGWPVSIFFSDIASMMPEPSAPKRIVERRLHALYQFEQYCGVVIARSAVPARFDGAMAEIRSTLLTGDLDWENDRVVALAQVWRGLKVTREAPKPPIK